MKILIENTVPLNNGDAALIFSVGNELKNKGYEVFYSTPQYELAEDLYPNENWILSPTVYRLSRVPFIGTLFLLFYLVKNKKIYTNFDAVVSAPGGYINSYYTLNNKIKLLSLYKKVFNKKVYIYSQSIGPLNAKDKKLLKKHAEDFDLIYARDDISMERLNNLEIKENAVQTKDAAFLFEREDKKELQDKDLKKVAISVREWNFDGRDKSTYYNLITNIVTYFYNEGFEVTFLSTCQGIPSYRDDSIVAEEIFDILPINIKERVNVDGQYYNVFELRERLKDYDFVIGTRLHMCILSWLSSVPAFNISYEEKGKESYEYLGLSKYSIDYNFNSDVSSLLDEFTSATFDDTFKILDSINIESKKHLDFLVKNINN